MTDDARAVVDAHIHQWDPFTTPRLVSGPAKVIRRAPFLAPLLMRVFPRSAREFAGDPQYLLNRYLPDDYAADAAPAPVAAIVHVEAGWQGKRPVDCVDETRWVASLPFGTSGMPSLDAIVVHADPAEPQVADVLDEHLRASPLVRGARCTAAYSPDPGIMDFANRPNLLSEPAFLRGFAAVARARSQFRDLALRSPVTGCRHAGRRVPRDDVRVESLCDTDRSARPLRPTHRTHRR